MDIPNLNDMAAMKVSEMAGIGMCVKLVGCNGQKVVMFVSIVPYSNTGKTFIYFIFYWITKIDVISDFRRFFKENKGKTINNNTVLNDSCFGLL